MIVYERVEFVKIVNGTPGYGAGYNERARVLRRVSEKGKRCEGHAYRTRVQWGGAERSNSLKRVHYIVTYSD